MRWHCPDVADRVLFIDGGVVVEQGAAKVVPTSRSIRGRRISCAACCIRCDAAPVDVAMMVTHTPLALRPSPYADTAVPPVAAPPLDSDKTVSVAIIGGGFAGLSTALHLSEQGTDAIVLEAQEPGWGASGNNGGQLNPGLKPIRHHRSDLRRRTRQRMIAFAYNTPVSRSIYPPSSIACEARHFVHCGRTGAPRPYHRIDQRQRRRCTGE